MQPRNYTFYAYTKDSRKIVVMSRVRTVSRVLTDEGFQSTSSVEGSPGCHREHATVVYSTYLLLHRCYEKFPTYKDTNFGFGVGTNPWET